MLARGGCVVDEPRFMPEAAPRYRIDDLVHEQVRKRGISCAVRDTVSGQSLTYRQLWQASGHLAGGAGVPGHQADGDHRGSSEICQLVLAEHALAVAS
jgi:hypothetical protein